MEMDKVINNRIEKKKIKNVLKSYNKCKTMLGDKENLDLITDNLAEKYVITICLRKSNSKNCKLNEYDRIKAQQRTVKELEFMGFQVYFI